MKYLVGSIIISFGILVVAVLVLASMNIQAPEGSMKYFSLVWFVLTIICYPLAKKLIRE